MSGNLQTILLVITSFVLIFIITRMFWLWFFKIEERTELQREQNQLLNAILQKINTSDNNSEIVNKTSDEVIRKAKEYDLKYGNKNQSV